MAHNRRDYQRPGPFLTHVATTAMIIIAVTMIGLDFPFDPAQAALTTFTVGVPSLSF